MIKYYWWKRSAELGSSMDFKFCRVAEALLSLTLGLCLCFIHWHGIILWYIKRVLWRLFFLTSCFSPTKVFVAQLSFCPTAIIVEIWKTFKRFLLITIFFHRGFHWYIGLSSFQFLRELAFDWLVLLRWRISETGLLAAVRKLGMPGFDRGVACVHPNMIHLPVTWPSPTQFSLFRRATGEI